MSSKGNEFNQHDGQSNNATALSSPPPYSLEPQNIHPTISTAPDVPVGTFVPAPIDSQPSFAPAAYNPTNVATHSQTMPVAYPPVVCPPQASPQSAYHQMNVAFNNASPAFYQYPVQASHASSTSEKFPGPVAQPLGVPVQHLSPVSQPVQILQHRRVHVPDEMGFSILSMLCCCFYLGIPAVILASQANSLRHVDPERALSKARSARGLNIMSFVLGSVAIVAIVVYRYSAF